MNELKICQEELVEQEDLFDEERQSFRETMERNQASFDRSVAQYRSETQSLRKALKNHEENIQVERRRFNEHSEHLRAEINEARRNLRKIREKNERLRKE